MTDSAGAIADTRSLRTALGAFATGVTIVTTRRADGADVGLTANSFNSVSLEPPMVLWSLAKTSSSIEAFRAASHFAVHVLAADQDDLSGRFASKAADKFAGLELRRGRDGIPLLRACAARFECRTAFQHEGGDHVIFVGEVLDFTHSERPPLIFHGGRYGLMMRKDPPPAPSGTAESSVPPDDLIDLVSRAFHQIRSGAVEERRRRGWTEPEYAVLSVLGRTDDRTLVEIATMARFHDWTVGREAVASLRAHGLIAGGAEASDAEAGDADRIRLTAAGRREIIELIAMLKSAEADALEGFDDSEVHMLKQLLRRLTQRSEAELQAALDRAGQAEAETKSR